MNPRSRGSHSVNSGTKATNVITDASAARNGTDAFDIRSIVVSPISAATNKLTPRGGVE
jgi:hypothetical protein